MKLIERSFTFQNKKERISLLFMAFCDGTEALIRLYR